MLTSASIAWINSVMMELDPLQRVKLHLVLLCDCAVVLAHPLLTTDRRDPSYPLRPRCVRRGHRYPILL
jgi:hypothetical protein